MQKKTLLLDMDGVIADFHGAVCKIYGTNLQSVLQKHTQMPHKYAINEYMPIELSEAQMWADIDSRGTFWLDIEPYPWVHELWEYIKELDLEVIISTSPGLAPWNSAHKITWLRQHLPELHYTAWMIGKHKHLMANPNHILLDDCDHNVDSFTGAMGLGILFPQPWNRNHSFASWRMDYVKTRLLELTSDNYKIPELSPFDA